MLCAVAVYVAPFYFLSLVRGVLILVCSYLIAGIFSGYYVGSFARSEEWPDNFCYQLKYGPATLYLFSYLLLGLMIVNQLK
jgi:hypothetical protein